MEGAVTCSCWGPGQQALTPTTPTPPQLSASPVEVTPVGPIFSSLHRVWSCLQWERVWRPSQSPRVVTPPIPAAVCPLLLTTCFLLTGAWGSKWVVQPGSGSLGLESSRTAWVQIPARVTRGKSSASESLSVPICEACTESAPELASDNLGASGSAGGSW